MDVPELFDILQPRGLDNSIFWRVHHWRIDGKKEPIDRFRKWVTDHKIRESGSNELVRRRLELLYQWTQCLPGRTVDSQVWEHLAEAAWAAIPHVNYGYKPGTYGYKELAK
jgi:hypothetical protein